MAKDDFSSSEKELAQWLVKTHDKSILNILGKYDSGMTIKQAEEAWLLTARELIKRGLK